MTDRKFEIAQWFFHAYKSADNTQRLEYSSMINQLQETNPNEFLLLCA